MISISWGLGRHRGILNDGVIVSGIDLRMERQVGSWLSGSHLITSVP